jgi:hypothetical protein
MKPVYPVDPILIFAHVIAITGAVLWFVPRTRKRVSRLVVPGVGGLAFFLIAFHNLQLIGQWHAMFQTDIISHAPDAVAAVIGKFLFPAGYLLGAWALGFALAFQLVRWIERRQPRKPEDPSANPLPPVGS